MGRPLSKEWFGSDFWCAILPTLPHQTPMSLSQLAKKRQPCIRRRSNFKRLMPLSVSMGGSLPAQTCQSHSWVQWLSSASKLPSAIPQKKAKMKRGRMPLKISMMSMTYLYSSDVLFWAFFLSAASHAVATFAAKRRRLRCFKCSPKKTSSRWKSKRKSLRGGCLRRN